MSRAQLLTPEHRSWSGHADRARSSAIYAQVFAGCIRRARRRRHNRARIGYAAACATSATAAPSRIRLWLTCRARSRTQPFTRRAASASSGGSSSKSSGRRVVGVAGGKGELSFELENLHDCSCVVVDPRAPMLDDVSQRFRSFRARGFLDNGDEASRRASGGAGGLEEAASARRRCGAHSTCARSSTARSWTRRCPETFLRLAAALALAHALGEILGERAQAGRLLRDGRFSTWRRRPTLWRRRARLRAPGPRCVLARADVLEGRTLLVGRAWRAPRGDY